MSFVDLRKFPLFLIYELHTFGEMCLIVKFYHILHRTEAKAIVQVCVCDPISIWCISHHQVCLTQDQLVLSSHCQFWLDVFEAYHLF